MRNKVFWLLFLFSVYLSWFMFPMESFAEEQSVRVTLPNFTVKLNGNEVLNQYRKYPLLVYKDITYIPMTWYDCRLLGLETGWSPDNGLIITKGNVASSYMPYKTSNKNRSSFKATIPSFGITINEKAVDNSKEEYPLLSFNDVTYFPLTWKFAHEFGWEYVWNDKEGLTIISDNPKINTAYLSAYAGENSVALFKSYYYFVETTGSTNQVYRAAVNNPSDKEQVYSYEVSTAYGFNKNLNFFTIDNELWFSYHFGGAIMGRDVFCKVNNDGKASFVHQGYLNFRNTLYGTLIINQSVPPSGNNLHLVPAGQTDNIGKNAGDPNLIYGWHIVNDGQSQSYGGDDSTTIIGENAYVMATSNPEDKGSLNHIYKINLKTNETSTITNFAVNHFRIFNNKLYYVKEEDHYLYSSNLNGSNEQKLSDNKATSWYEEINGIVYYTVAAANEQVYLYKADPSNDDTLVLKDPLESVLSVNGKLLCKLAAGGEYGLKVIVQPGNLRLAVTDQVSNLFGYDDFIVYVSAEDKSVKWLKL